jgi:hypothetical protein
VARKIQLTDLSVESFVTGRAERIPKMALNPRESCSGPPPICTACCPDVTCLPTDGICCG